MTDPVLTLSGISKSFPGVRALSEVSLELFAGKVTALVGENGAGKSTVVKILTGIYQPDAGEIRLDGRALHFASSDAAATDVTASAPPGRFLSRGPRRWWTKCRRRIAASRWPRSAPSCA